LKVYCSNCYHFTYHICVRRSGFFWNVYEAACLSSGTQGGRNFTHVGSTDVLDLCVHVQTKVMINTEFMCLQLALESSCLPVWPSKAVTSKADTTLQIQHLSVTRHLQHVLRRASQRLPLRQYVGYGDGVCGRGGSLQCCSK
jgi:hypothetical protein